MKLSLLTSVALLCLCPLSAQQIRTQSAGFEDYRLLLQAAGYEAYAFDLSEFLAAPVRYDITLSYREYADGERIASHRFEFGSNKTLLSDFAPEQRSQIAPEQMADPERGIYSQAERLVLGCYPSGVDSLARWVFSIPGMGRMGPRFRLRPLVIPGSERKFYRYVSRPFRIASFTPGEFIPLVFFGSMWYDEQARMFRFCGESRIASDLSSEIVGNVPHFFVIGIELHETKEQENNKK